MAMIRIVKRPLGEAPEWVRDAWIGVDLELVAGERTWNAHGVLSGPRSLLGHLWRSLTGQVGRQQGYAVNARAAIDRLAQSAPDAAGWWRTNVPHMLDGTHIFIFDSDACSMIA